MVHPLAVPNLGDRLAGEITDDQSVGPVVAAQYDPAVRKHGQGNKGVQALWVEAPEQHLDPVAQHPVPGAPQALEIPERSRTVEHGLQADDGPAGLPVTLELALLAGIGPLLQEPDPHRGLAAAPQERPGVLDDVCEVQSRPDGLVGPFARGVDAHVDAVQPGLH